MEGAIDLPTTGPAASSSHGRVQYIATPGAPPQTTEESAGAHFLARQLQNLPRIPGVPSLGDIQEAAGPYVSKASQAAAPLVDAAVSNRFVAAAGQNQYVAAAVSGLSALIQPAPQVKDKEEPVPSIPIVGIVIYQPLHALKRSSFVEGARTLWSGLVMAVHQPNIAQAVARSQRSIIVTLLCCYLLLSALILPFQLILLLVTSVLLPSKRFIVDVNAPPSRSTVFWSYLFSGAEDLREKISFSYIASELIWYVPFFVLLFIRYVTGGFERHFFTLLETQDKELHDALIRIHPMSVPELLYRQMKRGLTVAGKGLLFHTLWFFPSILLIAPFHLISTSSKIPSKFKIIGFFASFVAILVFFEHRVTLGRFCLIFGFAFMRLRGYTRSANLTPTHNAILIVICAVFAHPALHRYVILFFNVSVVTTALSLELLDPYISRARLTESQVRTMIQNNRWFLLGYGVPITLLLSVPLVGLLLWGFAQASAAVLLCRMTDVEINYDMRKDDNAPQEGAGPSM